MQGVKGGSAGKAGRERVELTGPVAFDDNSCWGHVLGRFAVICSEEAEAGTLLHPVAGTVDLLVHFHAGFRTIAMPSDERAVSKFDADPSLNLLPSLRD